MPKSATITNNMTIYITADIHGYYATWQKITQLVNPTDTLIIAGDLFGTRYPEYDSPAYQPENIRAEIGDINNLYYVYGNCDLPNFTPGFQQELRFELLGKRWLLTHGDKAYDTTNIDIVVTGHTHTSDIHTQNGLLYLNPGSPIKPRDGQKSIIVFDQTPLITALKVI